MAALIDVRSLLLRRLVRSVGYPSLIFVVVIAAWELGARNGLFPTYILPAPSLIVVRLASTWQLMLPHCLATCGEVILGFLLAVVVGIFLAAIIVYVRALEQAIYPWLVVIQVVPKVALGPLFVVWLGVGFFPKILIAFLLAFFPIMIDSIVGLRSIHRDSIFLLKSMGAGHTKRFFYLHLPNALPHIFGSLKVAITLAMVGAIVGEFIGAEKGLGYVLVVATGMLDTVLIFVALAWITAVSILFFMIISVLEKFFVSWHASLRNDGFATLS
jgi:NitT/TauT family transport system permease protein